MLEKLNDVPEGVVAVRAIGKVGREDYEQVLEPLIDEARRGGRRVRFLYEIGPEFEGFTPGAAWEDAKVGIRYLRSFGACALVTDRYWIRDSARLAGFFMSCAVRVFSSKDRPKAIEWLSAVPREVGLAHRLVPERGVLVIEVKHALSAQDFDALALAVDPWIESHGGLQGVVIHARAFPGWENLGSLIRHVRFVRDHHTKIKRLALAVDGKLAGLAPRIAEHFVRAEIRVFPSDQLDGAVAWAAGDECVQPTAHHAS
jgi:SpoIIAA-like